MNKHESTDWRTIAHEEYENRKRVELDLSKTNLELANVKEALTTTNNYNNMLLKKLAEFEERNTVCTSKLHRSIELLKNAKLLFAKQKQEIANLNELKQKLEQELLKKSALLDAEAVQHERTSNQLAQALKQLATTVAVNTYTAITSNLQETDIIYGHDYSDEECFFDEIVLIEQSADK